MNPQKKPKSLQERLKQIQRSSFVGREEQVAVFRRNLELSIEDDRRRFLFNVWGQGGVGKSTLLNQFRKISEEAKVIAASTNEDEKSVPEAMARLAEHFKQQGHKLAQFSERYEVFRQKRQELEADPEAPQGFSAFLGRTVAKTGVRLARRVPVGGAIFDFVDEDAVTTQAGEWAAYVAKKLTNKDEVRLVNEPVAELTPLFLKDICKVAEKFDVALFFDTYERTEEFLDDWLRDILEGRYGDAPLNLLLVMAGRQELDKNRWAIYEGAIVHLPLEPFTEEEARQYLVRKGVTSDRVIEVILRLSGRLPLLIATLAAEIPDDPAQVGDPSGTAVERFLKWVDDPKRRQVALDAALPQCLNRDVLAQLNGEEEADALFSWLKEMPFVEERTDGWAYHEVVRTQMLRHKRLVSPKSWADLHGKLASYYDTLRNNLQLDEDKRQRDPVWQNYTLSLLYHRLCGAPQSNLSVALNEFLAALKTRRVFAERWAAAIMQAGVDVDVAEVQRWGRTLVDGLKAYDEDCYDSTAEMFTAVVNYSKIEAQWQSVAFAWRGETYRQAKCYEEALKDFDQAIELDSKYAWAIAHRGETYRLIERYEEALKDFDQAIELDSKYVWAVANRGQTYRLMKHYEEALKDFDQTIELNPEYNTWAIANRGETHRLMKCYEDALKDFDRAVELSPEYTWAIAHRGLTHRLIERHEEALKDFDRVIELDSNYAWAVAHRGETYRLTERYEEALKDFDQAIELNPKYAWAIRKRGEICLILNRPEEALLDFNRDVELDPSESGWVQYELALTYQVLNQLDKANNNINLSIKMGQQRYEKDFQDWRNTFNLAIYYLAAGNLEQAKHFYRDGLFKGASLEYIRMAIRDLDDFLIIFPEHQQARAIRQAIEKELQKRSLPS